MVRDGRQANLPNGSLQRLIKPALAIRENSALTALENLAHENLAVRTRRFHRQATAASFASRPNADMLNT